MPFEFFGLVWCVAVSMAAFLSPRSAHERAANWIFVSGVPIGGLGVWLSYRHPAVVPVMVAAVVCLGMVAISATQVSAHLFRQLASDTGVVATNARGRAMVLGFLALAGLSAAILQFNAQRVSSSEAQERAYRNWYLSRSRAVSRRLPSRVLRVEVFTDYECADCTAALARYESIVDDFREAVRVPVELVVRDFPLDPECNGVAFPPAHPTACRAAVAVRLARRMLDEGRTRRLAWRFYKAGTGLSRANIREILAESAPALQAPLDEQYGALLKDVVADVAYARQLGVDSVPAVAVNGVKLPKPDDFFLERALGYAWAAQ